MTSGTQPTVLIVPGLRDHVAAHWQTLLAASLDRVVTVPPMGRLHLSCDMRVRAIERAAQEIEGPLVIVAHSGGCIAVAHWARVTQRAVQGALLATPPDFDTPMREGYPSIDELDAAGWLPVPRSPLPFRSIVACSRNDPLGSVERVSELAAAWGSELVDIGKAGHLNPASGHGDWPMARDFIARLSAAN
ncbi:MAG: RBBP9/YdeN family alpha/beta hydrolase [Ramlibacter sp.]|nr:alpha/beta hydrolase [Ramlibacter sp.]